MATLKQLSAKIKSVGNTKKITKAMKLVSTVKLKKAELLAKSSKAYAVSLKNVTAKIALRLQKYHSMDDLSLIQKRDVRKVDIIFVTSDKGLCGGFNSKTIRAVSDLIDNYESKNMSIRLRAIGKKGISYFTYRGYDVFDSMVSSHPDYTLARDFVKISIEDYVNKNTDEVILVHNGFKNMILQELSINSLLPIDTSIITDQSDEEQSALDFEPDDDKEILESLIQKYCEYSLYYSLIDSLAAEHSSRMQAMDSATKNATEVSDTLSTLYNKTRQALVTNELIEIIGGVEAMK